MEGFEVAIHVHISQLSLDWSEKIGNWQMILDAAV